MTEERSEITVSITDLVRFLVRGALPAVLVAAAVAYGTFSLVERQPAQFRAEATLLVARSTTGLAQFGISPVTAPVIELNAYGVAAVSDAVLTDALQRMGVDDPGQQEIRALRNAVDAEASGDARDNSLLSVESLGASPDGAVRRANAVAQALVEWDDRRSSETLIRVIATLEQQIEALSEQIRAFQTTNGDGAASQIEGLVRLRAEQQQQLAYARALVASAQGSVSVLQVADSTARQVAPRPVLMATIAAVLAFVAVYGLMLLRTAMNTRLRSTADVASVSELTVLAEFPSTRRAGDPRLIEAANYLRASLLFNSEQANPRVFMVTSSVAGEGKSTITAELAKSFARFGHRTLLIDADLRTPALLDRFPDLKKARGNETTETWLGGMEKDQVMATLTFPDGQRLYVLPQPEPVANASELLGRNVREALASVTDFDVIIIDTPPVLSVADALMIAPHCTGTILVVDMHRSDRRRLVAAADSLRRVGVPLLGAVPNRVEVKGSSATMYGVPYGQRSAGSGS